MAMQYLIKSQKIAEDFIQPYVKPIIQGTCVLYALALFHVCTCNVHNIYVRIICMFCVLHEIATCTCTCTCICI